MTKKKKSPNQQPTAIQMANNLDIKLITGIKLKYLSVKGNGYGTNHMFAVLDETPLKEFTELGKDMKMTILGYNGKYCLKINSVKITELPVETCFKKGNPYIIDLMFSKYDFEKKAKQITGYSISEINKNLLSYYIYIYI